MGGGRAAALTSSQGGSSDTMTLSIYDIQNQFVGKDRKGGEGKGGRNKMKVVVECVNLLQLTRLLSIVVLLMFSVSGAPSMSC